MTDVSVIGLGDMGSALGRKSRSADRRWRQTGRLGGGGHSSQSSNDHMHHLPRQDDQAY
jgi:prephenate dehydrogenase